MKKEYFWSGLGIVGIGAVFILHMLLNGLIFWFIWNYCFQLAVDLPCLSYSSSIIISTGLVMLTKLVYTGAISFKEKVSTEKRCLAFFSGIATKCVCLGIVWITYLIFK